MPTEYGEFYSFHPEWHINPYDSANMPVSAIADFFLKLDRIINTIIGNNTLFVVPLQLRFESLWKDDIVREMGATRAYLERIREQINASGGDVSWELYQTRDFLGMAVDNALSPLFGIFLPDLIKLVTTIDANISILGNSSLSVIDKLTLLEANLNASISAISVNVGKIDLSIQNLKLDNDFASIVEVLTTVKTEIVEVLTAVKTELEGLKEKVSQMSEGRELAVNLYSNSQDIEGIDSVVVMS